jgi:coenzyme F420-reducing hydrogenase alpha subunit
MNLEGRVHVSAGLRGGQVQHVVVQSDRPLIGELVLRGQPCAEAPGLLSRSLSLCGRSQAVVCAAACEAVAGVEPQPAALGRRARELDAETVQEHAWRLLLDWPRLTGQPEDIDLLGRIRALARGAAQSDSTWGAARDALSSLVAARLLGEPAHLWLDQGSAARWLEWAAQGHTAAARTLHHMASLATVVASPVPFLAWPSSEQVIEGIARPALTEAAFARRPTLAGRAHETGPLPRLARHPALAELARARPLVARAFARLAELVAILLGAVPPRPAECATLGPGRAAAWVEMARGLLVHALETDSDRIARYAIVAPTEWNFHPQGALPAALEDQPAAGLAAARHLVETAASVLDPCVALTADVHHA